MTRRQWIATSRAYRIRRRIRQVSGTGTVRVHPSLMQAYEECGVHVIQCIVRPVSGKLVTLVTINGRPVSLDPSLQFGEVVAA